MLTSFESETLTSSPGDTYQTFLYHNIVFTSVSLFSFLCFGSPHSSLWICYRIYIINYTQPEKENGGTSNIEVFFEDTVPNIKLTVTRLTLHTPLSVAFSMAGEQLFPSCTFMHYTLACTTYTFS